MYPPARCALVEQALAIVGRHGITRAGVCSLDAIPGRIPCRGVALLPEHGSVLTLLLPYYAGEFPRRNVALYAIPDDYHRLAGGILEELTVALRQCYPAHRFVPFVDSSPIPEVEAACRAALGFRGRNGQLITREYGSLVFLCEVVTDLVLEPEEYDQPISEGCGTCRRCLEACPTAALTPTGVDRARCRSAITQKKGALTPWEQEQVAAGGLAWGCDICTLACPHNAHPVPTPIVALREGLTPMVTREELDSLLPRKSFGWRGRAVIERNLERIYLQQTPR